MTKRGIIVLLGIGIITLGTLTYFYRKDIKITIKKRLEGDWWFDKSLKWYRDLNTLSVLNKLHPSVRKRFYQFVAKVEKDLGLQVIATSGYRDFEKQNRLHDINSKNKKGGYSLHNFGLALDVNIVDPKTNKIILRKATSKNKWVNSGVVRIANNLGLKWGGDFKTYYDPVHFAFKNTSTDELRKKYYANKIDDNGYVLLT